MFSNKVLKAWNYPIVLWKYYGSIRCISYSILFALCINKNIFRSVSKVRLLWLQSAGSSQPCQSRKSRSGKKKSKKMSEVLLICRRLVRPINKVCLMLIKILHYLKKKFVFFSIYIKGNGITLNQQEKKPFRSKIFAKLMAPAFKYYCLFSC